MSSSVSVRQLTQRQVTPYRVCISAAAAAALGSSGWAEFTSTTKGLPMSCNSRMTRSSASR